MVTENKKRTPSWALDPFKRLLEGVQEAFQLLELSMQGIAVLQAMPKVVEALAKADPSRHGEDSDRAGRLDRARKEADLAGREVAKGFPALHAQATISLWGDLEDAVRTFLARWIKNDPAAKSVEAVYKLKVCLGEYESMDGDDRALYIVDRLEQELESRNRRGVARFECLLRPFGFSGSLDKGLEKNLFELYHVRNVLVHKGGIADRKLVQACPWLNLSVGQQVNVDHAPYARYHEAVATYVLELIVRVAGRFGFDRSELIPDDMTRPLEPDVA